MSLQRKITAAMLALGLCSMLGACGTQFTNTTETTEENRFVSQDVENADTGETKTITDKQTLYENQDPSSVVTMYLTVSEGNASDHTDHTWTEVNSYSMYDYEEMGEERYAVNGLLQVGDENGPVEGETGYGQTTPNATVTIRGQSSSTAQQKNYKIKLRDEKGTWNDQKVINLNKHVSDYTRFANKLNYDLMSELPGMMSLRTQFVHLYVKDTTEGGNGQFRDYGLYTQVEQLNKRALKTHGLDQNGQLYKVNDFEFYRYEDTIRLKSDADYDQEAFEQRLEIKGNDDHSKLIAMLDDVNDYSVPIRQIMEQWFDEDNLFSWMAYHILMGNVDTNARNCFLYSPLNSNTWYLLSWDNDGAFSDTRAQFSGEDRGWEKGISNYWGNVLFRRILLDDSMRDKLDQKIEEYRGILTEEKLKSLIDTYAPVVETYAFAYPDAQYMPLTQSEYDRFLEMLPTETERNYELYKESLTAPMPFFIGIPVSDGSKTDFIWDNSVDFQAENITYTFELATDYSFTSPVVKEEGLTVPQYEYAAVLQPGQYFIRVTAQNESGQTQGAFDYYRSADGEKQSGIKCFFVSDDGTIQEDTYEQ